MSSSRRSVAADGADGADGASGAAGENEMPPSPLEDDLGVEDFDLKQDHLLGPSPVPPPPRLPDDDDDHSHDHDDDDDDDDEAAAARGSPGTESFRMKKGGGATSGNNGTGSGDHDHDHIVMLDEERDDKGHGGGTNGTSDSPDLELSPQPLTAEPPSSSSLSVASTPSPKRKRRERAVRKHPGAPKRFKSSYICFFTAKQPEIKERLGTTASVGEISKESAQMWKKLTPEEKSHWDHVAAKDKERYEAEKEAYTGPWQVSNKRQKKDKGSPKRPMSAFLHFSQTRRQAVKDDHPNMRNPEISRTLGEVWRGMSQEEKRPFVEREKVERGKYKVAMAKWKSEADQRRAEEKKREKEEMKKRKEDLKKQGERIMAYQKSYDTSSRRPPTASRYYNSYSHQQQGHHAAAAATSTGSAQSGSKPASGANVGQGHSAAGPGGSPTGQWQHMAHRGPAYPWVNTGYAAYYYPGYVAPVMYHQYPYPPYAGNSQAYPYGPSGSPSGGTHPHQHHPGGTVGSSSTPHRSSAFTQTQPRPQPHHVASTHHHNTDMGRGEISEDIAKAFAITSPKSSGPTGPTSADSTTPIPLLNDLPPSIPSPDM
eukprot:CAMPEP_0113516192 /NCGR_PEP_ID=MMETSP0014_2-20120614/41398_1 /TAXON_ID=2857 /ORGANISM="Nitzschia sp." /LENGTH=596 /DNA_ID=CAMNT_0000412913 /DNA_START=275 /DNA_END=2065 /DNA_ORIENTATION=- /assembly_acc=CAM_ASM_000159